MSSHPTWYRWGSDICNWHLCRDCLTISLIWRMDSARSRLQLRQCIIQATQVSIAEESGQEKTLKQKVTCICRMSGMIRWEIFWKSFKVQTGMLLQMNRVWLGFARLLQLLQGNRSGFSCAGSLALICRGWSFYGRKVSGTAIYRYVHIVVNLEAMAPDSSFREDWSHLYCGLQVQKLVLDSILTVQGAKELVHALPSDFVLGSLLKAVMHSIPAKGTQSVYLFASITCYSRSKAQYNQLQSYILWLSISLMMRLHGMMREICIDGLVHKSRFVCRLRRLAWGALWQIYS